MGGFEDEGVIGAQSCGHPIEHEDGQVADRAADPALEVQMRTLLAR